jgi:hypothetical protein
VLAKQEQDRTFGTRHTDNKEQIKTKLTIVFFTFQVHYINLLQLIYFCEYLIHTKVAMMTKCICS